MKQLQKQRADRGIAKGKAELQGLHPGAGGGCHEKYITLVLIVEWKWTARSACSLATWHSTVGPETICTRKTTPEDWILWRKGSHFLFFGTGL